MTTDLTMLASMIAPADKDVLDVGCGGGALVRDLAGLGARVIGLEVSREQLAPAVARDGGSGSRYLIGRAQALPLDDASVDVVVFLRTLHHVAPADLTQALREARRVLRRSGQVYVAEPLAQGDFFALTSLVEDESEVREAAQRALAQAGSIGLDRLRTVDYEVPVYVADLAALRHRIVSVDPQRAEVFDARTAELRQALERLGVAAQRGGRCFVSPTRADLLGRAG